MTFMDTNMLNHPSQYPDGSDNGSLGNPTLTGFDNHLGAYIHIYTYRAAVYRPWHYY